MNRILAFTVAVGTSALLFLATTSPAFAQGGTGYHVVPAVAPASREAWVASDVIWKLSGEGGFVAPQANSRPAIVCAQAAKKIGKVVSFTAQGQAFDEAALAKCNEKAK